MWGNMSSGGTIVFICSSIYSMQCGYKKKTLQYYDFIYTKISQQLLDLDCGVVVS